MSIYIYISVYLYIYISIYIYKYIFKKRMKVGHAFFSKERNVLRSFAFFCIRTLCSLRSFTFFAKERCVLRVLLRSLQKNIAFFKRTQKNDAFRTQKKVGPTLYFARLTSAKCALAAATESAEAFTPTTAHGTLRFLQVCVMIGRVNIVNRIIGAVL